MLNIRQKLSIGFGGLLAILVIIGIQAIYLIFNLGQSIDVILRENYRSVIACQDMKEAIERMDSGALFYLLGYDAGKALIDENQLRFQKALDFELSNITLIGEKEKAEHIRDLYAQYRDVLHEMQNPNISHDNRTAVYFKKQLPVFYQTKDAADAVLQMNQQNMSDANNKARTRATSARQQMGLLLFTGTIFAVTFMFFTRRWILHPVKRLMQSANEIRKGNLDLCLPSTSDDEIGQLSTAFNDMAQSLRDFRRSDQAKLALLQRSTQQTFKNLQDITAIVDLEGTIDVATEAARTAFGLQAGSRIQDSPHEWLRTLYSEACTASGSAAEKEQKKIFQCFINGREHFFQPHAVPVLDARHQTTGVLMLIKDVTQQQQHDDMKRGLISTVSHQLKTPLTSIRMAIHLLLEEKVGTLTEKQTELLLAARDDSDRLNAILEDLLDISRIESGKAPLHLDAVSPQALAAEALEHFAVVFQDKGVTLKSIVPEDLPNALVDKTRISHVFDNLLSNALKYTMPGGTVTIEARADGGRVVFSISDTGCGIPHTYLDKIFTQFFRVPNQAAASGAGLGLAIAREIVEAHGGTITVASAEGEGSTFMVALQQAESTSALRRIS